jgi:hypothetical protein
MTGKMHVEEMWMNVVVMQLKHTAAKGRVSSVALRKLVNSPGHDKFSKRLRFPRFVCAIFSFNCETVQLVRTVI